MALITLNRSQFLKKRPKGDYQSYLRYLGTQRAGIPHGAPQGKLVDLPMNPAAVNKVLLQNVMSGALNPKQMRQQAVKSVNDAIKAALGDLRGTTAAAQKQANDQARASEGFGRYLADARVADAGQIQQLYGDAAAQQAQFAQGLTGAVGSAAQASDAANQADIAAAAGGGAVAGYHAPDPGQMANIANYVGGYLPSANLAENAAYAAADTRAQALADAARLGLEGAGMRAKGVDLQAELARKRAELVAGKPAAIREAIKGLSDDQRANLATLANVLYLQNTQAKTTAEQLGTFQGQPTINTYRDKQGRLRQYDPDRYQVKTNKDGSQWLAPLPVPKSPSSSTTTKNQAGFTPSQQATQDRARNKAVQGARGNMLTVAQNTGGPLYKRPPIDLGEFTPPVRKTYAEARQYLLTNYANDLIRQYPGERARILKSVDEVLASAGFKKRAAAKSPPASGGSIFGALNPGFLPKVPSR